MRLNKYIAQNTEYSNGRVFLNNKKIIIKANSANSKTYLALNKPAGYITTRIVIHEGRNRQIRKMFDQLGHPVKYLQRIRIGKIFLDSLKKGSYRELTTKEIQSIIKN